jgi:hypothetical protein
MKIAILRKKIDILFLFSLLLKNKILTLLSIVLGLIIIFTISSKENNKHIATAKVSRDLPYGLILKIKRINPDHTIELYAERALQLKINSYKNFLEFINQNDNKYFLKILDKYNLNTNSFFFKNFYETKGDSYVLYSFIYPKEMNGNNFLNNYIIFSKEKLREEIYLDLKFYINTNINKNLNFLEIANDLNIEFPDRQSKDYGFNKGKKVLSAEISQLQKQEKLLSMDYLDWDPFILAAFDSKSTGKDKTYYQFFFLKIIFGFLLGILIIFLFLFSKNIIKNI